MFITCSFKQDGSGRAYTYAYDLPEDVSPGDRAVVLGPEGDEKVVTVVDVDVEEPPFTCKPILSLKQPEDAGEREG